MKWIVAMINRIPGRQAEYKIIQREEMKEEESRWWCSVFFGAKLFN